MTERFSWLRYRSCEVKRPYRSARRAALDAAVLRLRGQNVEVYGPCEWCSLWHVGHPPGRRGSLVA
jgi:hypothetical protein